MENFPFLLVIFAAVLISVSVNSSGNHTRITSRRDFIQKKKYCRAEKYQLQKNYSSSQNPANWTNDYSEECKDVDSFTVRNMTKDEAMNWLWEANGDANSLRMMTDQRTGLTTQVLKEVVQSFINSTYDDGWAKNKMVMGLVSGVGDAYFERIGGLNAVTVNDTLDFGESILEMLSVHSYDKLSSEVFDHVLDWFNNKTAEDMSSMEQHNDTDGEPEFQQHGSLMQMMLNDPMRVKAICRSAFRRYRNLDTASSADLDRLRFLLQCAKPSECKKISNTWVQNNIDILSNLPLNCKNDAEYPMTKQISHLFPTASVCARSLVVKALSGNQALNISSIQDLNRLKELAMCIPGSYFTEAIDIGGCGFAKAALDAGIEQNDLMRYTAANCIQLPTNMSEVNCSQIITAYGSSLARMKMSFFKNIPKAVLCDATCVTAFKDVDGFPAKLKRRLAKKCFADQVINSAAVDELGSMVTDLPPSKFQEINAADLERNLDSIKADFKAAKSKRRRRKKAIMKELGKKMMQSGKIASIRDSREIMKEMSLKDLKAAVTNIETDLLGDLENVTQELGFTDSQNKWVMQQLKKSKRASNYTVEEIREKKSIVKGFLRSDIKEMADSQTASDDPQGIEMAKALCEQPNFPLSPLLSINRDMIVGALEAQNSSNPFSFLTEYDVDGLGCQCMMHFKGDELSQMSQEVCSGVCSKIGSCDRFRCLVPKHRRDVLGACFNCMNLTSNNLTEEDLTSIGPNLLSEFTQAEMESKITGATLTLKIFELKGMCMNKKFRTTIKNKLSSTFGNNGSAIDEETLRQLGGAIMFLSQAMQQQLDKSVLASITSDIMEMVDPSDETAVNLKKCCEQWLSRDDHEELKQLKQNLMITIKDAVLFKIQNARRRRSTVIWTCDDIRLVGEAFTISSDAELNAIPEEEYKECLPDIGMLSMWTDIQKQVLLNKTVQVYNSSACNMSADLLVNLGYISQAIEDSDLQCLPLTDTDLVSSLGGMSGWTAAKLDSIAERFMSENQITNMSDVQGSDISMLGEIMCGFTPTELGDLGADKVGGSSTQLGKLEDCSVEQYTALKKRAVDENAFGHIKNWSAADVAELKNILIGLELQDVPHLSGSAIEGLEAQVIAQLPGPVFAAMSKEQFNSLVSTQVALVTEEQRNHLSAEQKTQLDNIMHGIYQTDSDNTGGNNNNDTPSRAETVLTTVGWILSLALTLVLLF